jgi:8-oxo-dGTP pyrophosphatase MutT (NUDIX family)
MSGVGEGPTRCAFVVCRFDAGGKPRIVLMKDPRWGDYTLIGGHEEPEDNKDLESTARRETLEELGCSPDSSGFRLFSLTDEISFGPTWSRSAHRMKTYTFKYYGIRFACDPEVRDGYNSAGFLLKSFSAEKLARYSALFNVVKLFLATYRKGLTGVPLSWHDECSLPDNKSNDERRSDASQRRIMLEETAT